MNKKKSKALAFLLAASLLVPSANGIVSAAELENTTTINQAVSEKDFQGVIKVGSETFTDLVEAVKKAKESNVNTINISGTIDVSDKSDINIAGLNLKGENDAKIININTNNRLFYVTKKENPSNCITKIEGITFEYDGGYTDLIYHTAGSLEIYNCIFNGINNKSILNLIRSEGKDNSIKFENNVVNANCRACITGINGGSSIKNNEFNMIQERLFNDNKDRTGVLSTTVTDGTLEISGNTFKNANRAIAVDNSTVPAEFLKIENNKFIDTRFAFELDIRENGNNNGKKYNISNNYFEFEGKVGVPKIQDSEIKGEKRFQYATSKNDTNSSEIVLEADDKRVEAYPYYSEIDKNGNIVESSKVEEILALVGDKSFNNIADALAEAKKSNQPIELKRDFELRDKINIGKGENITITSSNKSVIDLMNTDLINIVQGGSLTLDNVELRANKDAINYIVQYGDLTINKCNITAIDSVKGITNIVKSGGADVKLVLTNSNISVNARGGFVAVGSGSVIKNNTIDLKGEKAATDGKRTGIISIVAKGDGKVEIVDNTFMDANRGIGVDWSDIKAENLTIKGNKFIDVRYAFEIDPIKANNQNRNYDLSRNYFRFDSKVSAPKIQDAHARDLQGANDFTYEQNDGSTEFVLGDYRGETFEKDLPSIKDGPYYTNENKTELSDGSHIPSIPSKPIKPVYDHTKVIGSDRYDTAAKIADKLGSYDNVVLVNATSTMSDGLSASGLAGKEDSAILLTKKDSIPKVTMDRIRKVKKVYIIGGEAAISAKVVNQITVAGVKVERIGGKNRVETSELVAKKIGNYKKAFVVNGFKGEDDAMSASSVAAREEAPILLTNGKSSTHAKKYGVKYYVVGGNSVVNKSIANKYNAEVLAGRDRYATNREVIAEFYGASETLYFANGETLVDALTASTIAKDKGLVLVGRNSDNDILNKKNTIQVGGMNFHIDFEK